MHALRVYIFIFVSYFLLLACSNNTKSMDERLEYFVKSYSKQEINIKMRDGINLFTAIYQPKNQNEKNPIIIWRTPYSCSPYGKNNFFTSRLNTFFHFINQNYIIVIQDVRGRFMSEGEYVNVRPYIPKKNKNEIDESTDAYDTIEWLVNNVENNNGNVGVWGISYPGFYAAMSAIDAHPALKAVSPQAPIADWFIGDDMRHNGAFTLLLNFNFFDSFGAKRDSLTTVWSKGLDYPSPDAYNFFLDLGPLKNVNKFYYKNEIPFWDSTISHPNYDEYWQKRNTLPHFSNIKPAVMTVGGWYDGEDLYGAIKTYEAIEHKNPINNNILVMGPWPHGGWTRLAGDKFGDMEFESETSKFYVEQIELPFFNSYLKNQGKNDLPEAYIFNTGKNIWRRFKKYPPNEVAQTKLFLSSDQKLSFTKVEFTRIDFNEFFSDPQKPVPYTNKSVDSQQFYFKEYMVEDQRFASSRPDVLVFESTPLDADLTIIGEINSELFVSTSGSDSDWIVKVIDVFPDDEPNPKPNPKEIELGGYQMMVRGEILRGKYRNSFSEPEPFVPNKITKINLRLNDVCHTFKKNHKIMIQIQSSWFPLFDINPQKFINIFEADEKDFIKTYNRVYFSKNYPSHIAFNVLD